MNEFRTPKGTVLPVISLKGKPYLQVAHRLVWFREEHPDWTIETELVRENENGCISKATIKNESGRIISTAHKSETKAGFFNYREKSETGAIGRCLGLAGYGTQFMAEELDEGENLVDSPIERAKR